MLTLISTIISITDEVMQDLQSSWALHEIVGFQMHLSVISVMTSYKRLDIQGFVVFFFLPKAYALAHHIWQLDLLTEEINSSRGQNPEVYTLKHINYN